ncbi:hypothetical protein ACMFMG_003188 [Clarireedia jacksonii]
MVVKAHNVIGEVGEWKICCAPKYFLRTYSDPNSTGDKQNTNTFKMTSTTPPSIAIIGAGISGLILALSLQHCKIPCQIYESRPSPLNIGGAIMLSPNSLRILQTLGIYQRIRTQGYNFDTSEYKDTAGKLLEIQEFGGEAKYGFRGLRVYRYVLIDVLLEMVKERGIGVEFGKKFSHVVSESEESDLVEWEFTDGTRDSAALLVGADGIHSSVRRYLYPDLEPAYTGLAGITAAVPTSQLQLPENYHIPVTIVSAKGAFVIAPQQSDGSEVLIGKQFRMEEKTRDGWKDKEELIKFLQSGNELFPEIVHRAVSNIDLNSNINVWPFYIVPELAEWRSPKGRVVILGDAAHAVPPSAGQGINLAVEDGYMLALLLAELNMRVDKISMRGSLKYWQEYRQARVEKIIGLNKQVDLRRLPGAEEQTREPFDLRWLYNVDIEGDVRGWVAGRGK